ncbi:hypothetical protein ACQP00_05770 [Dactylosporangium sp. CS-047395]|uniref:hypothetical protein n=1 Tax=Dactylosporangium sp. CS-047395 TaxID=3239936 RepID=UPI003D8FC070
MAQDVHVTSKAIRATGTALVGIAKPDLQRIRDEVPETAVPFPSFGLIGIGFQVAHERVQDYAMQYLEAAGKRLDVFADKLNEVAQGWEQAESANTVQVR